MQWGYLSPQAINKGFNIRILFAVLITVNSGKILKLLTLSNLPQDIGVYRISSYKENIDPETEKAVQSAAYEP